MDRNDGSKAKRKRMAYTDEFRRSVVDHLLASGKPIAQVAAEFGISDGNLRMWKMRYGPESQVDNVVPKTPEELVRENQQLRKELARVVMQRDILKKPFRSFRNGPTQISHDCRVDSEVSDHSLVRGAGSGAQRVLPLAPRLKDKAGSG